MNITSNIGTIRYFLEENKLVGNHRHNSVNIKNLSFHEIKNCCSLSNPRSANRFFHRIIALFKTKIWMNDANIGKSLVYEFLWISSKVIGDIKEKNYHEKNTCLSQLELINQVLNEIILTNFQQVTHPLYPNVIAIPEINMANPEISQLFPIKIHSSIGAHLAKKISRDIKSIYDLYHQAEPHQIFIKQLEEEAGYFPLGGPTVYTSLQPHLRRNTTVENIWEEYIRHFLIINPITLKNGTKRTYDDKGDVIDEEKMNLENKKWGWTNKSDQEKINEACSTLVIIKQIEQTYLNPSKQIPPYKIYLKIE